MCTGLTVWSNVLCCEIFVSYESGETSQSEHKDTTCRAPTLNEYHKRRGARRGSWCGGWSKGWVKGGWSVASGNVVVAVVSQVP